MNIAEVVTERPKRKIWLFGVNLPYDDLTAILYPDLEPAQRSAFSPDFTPTDGEYREPLFDLLGVEWLDHDFVEVIDTLKLGDLGLAGYLVQVVGINEAQVMAAHGIHAALRGPVIIVFEEAFGGQPTALHPDPRLVFLGHYTDEPAPVVFRATPFVPATPTPRVKGYGALVAPVIVFAVVALVYWGK